MYGFRFYFTPLTGVLFTFPSRYWFTIGRQVVFSLARWSSRIPTGFHVSRGTRDTPRALRDFAYGAFTLFGRPFQTLPLSLRVPCRSPTTPEGISSRRFGLFPFRSPLLRESRLISFPSGTEMFQFPELAPLARSWPTGHGVSPFGYRRIKARLAAPRRFSQLTASFIASYRQGIHRLPFVA